MFVPACVCGRANVCFKHFHWQQNNNSRNYVLNYFQGKLHVVSFNTMQLYKIDITFDSLLYVRKFSSGQPYTINVYDTESTKSFKGKQYIFFYVY